MPMFDNIKASMQQLGQKLLPCRLCESSPRLKHYVLCKSCWQQLPWLKQPIHRHELQIMAACYYHYPIDRILQQFKYE